MSTSKNNKRISVFDRLGPGNDESSTKQHRRYSSEKHGSSPGIQDKVRGHAYGSAHMHIEDNPSPAGGNRDRMARHRGSMSDYPPTSMTDGVEVIEESSKRISSGKPSRDPPEALKGGGVKGSRDPSGSGLVSGESDYESGEEEKKRKSYRSSDHEMSRRSKQSVDGLEEEGDGRRRKEKGHGDKPSGGHLDRPGSGHVVSDTKARGGGRRDGGVDHKRRKEEEQRVSSELGHKRKRDHFDDLPEVKKIRRSDHHSSKDADRHHSNSSKESDHYHSNLKDSDHHHGNQERKRRQDSIESTSRKDQQQRSWSPRTTTGSAERGRSGSLKGHKQPSGGSSRRAAPDAVGERSKGSEGSGRMIKALDWAAVTNLTERANTKLRDYPRTVLKKFKPGAILSNIEVSPSLVSAGSYQKIVDLVSAYVKEEQRGDGESPWAKSLREPSLDEDRLEEDKILSGNLNNCRRALIASDDYTLRRLLRKLHQHRSFLPPPPAPPPPANTWAAQHYQIVLKLYQDIPTKPTGKPAFRLQASKMGTILS